MSHDKVAILDAGAQYGKLIDRAVREICVESTILPMNTSLSSLIKEGKDSGNEYKAIIISGGPGSVYDTHSSLAYDPSIFGAFTNPNQAQQPLPILGICYGFQLINHVFDGVVEASSNREDGVFQITVDTTSPIYKGLEPTQSVLLTHGDSLVELGKGLKSNAVSGELIVGLEHEDYKIYGVQYHLEVDLTPCGKRVLRNFLYDVAGCKTRFTLPNRELSCIQDIRSRVKNGKVLLLLSGGVDSCTCAALLRKCLEPNQIIAIHIDNGFMRKKESHQIELAMKEYGLPIRVINATERFIQYPLSYLEYLDPTLAKPRCPCCRCGNAHGIRGDNGDLSERTGVTTKCGSCTTIECSHPQPALPKVDEHQHCKCCSSSSSLSKDPTKKIGEISTSINKSLRPDPSSASAHNDQSRDNSPSIVNGLNEHVYNQQQQSKLKTIANSVTTSSCCSNCGGQGGNQLRRRYSRAMPRSLEETLIKSGLGAHCFRNYDGEIMLKPLCRIVEPEIKRRIIGDVFVQVADDVIAELKLDPNEVYFCQGTLRPDLIESASHLASGKADLIKTHHNDTKLMRMLRAQGRVIEPLKDFHKDEVRALAKELSLPTDIIQRHPFPGPGLAIRIICSLDPFMDKTFTETNFILKLLVQVLPDDYQKICHSTTIIQKLKDSLSSADRVKLIEILTCNNRSTRYSAILLPIKTVGVQGDKRSYSYVCALSCSNTGQSPVKTEISHVISQPQVNLSRDDGGLVIKTGGQAPYFDNIPPSSSLDWSHLFTLAQIIPKVCHNVNRVVFVFGPEYKYPIIDVVPTYINNISLGILREADDIAHTVLKRSGHYNSVSQMPVILIPIQFDRTFDCTGQTPCLYSNNHDTVNKGGALLPNNVEHKLAHVDHDIMDTTSTGTVHQNGGNEVGSGGGGGSCPKVATTTTWPYSNDDPVLRSVVLRPFISSDFMTGLAAIPGKHIPFQVLDEMVLQLSTQVQGVSRILYDLTSKPPGTTEWE